MLIIVRCSNIIKQVNAQAQNGALFTSDIGLETGVKTRSCYFCLNRLWAWMKGVSYDKNEVAKSINLAFKDFDLSQLQVSDSELTNFYKNINQLNRTFGKGSKFDKSLIEEVLLARGRGVPKKKPTTQIPIEQIAPEELTRSTARPDLRGATGVKRNSNPSLVRKELQKRVEDPQKTQVFGEQIFALDLGKYGEDIEEVMGLLEPLGRGNRAARARCLETIMRNSSQIQLFNRLFDGIKASRVLSPSTKAPNHAVQRSTTHTYPQGIMEHAEGQFKGIFKAKNSSAFKVMDRNLKLIEPKYPHILEIYGDNDCLYKSLATMQYIKEESTEDLSDYQLKFAKTARKNVAAFLRNPENLKRIPEIILEHNFPLEEDLARIVRDRDMSKADIRDTYGGKTRDGILQTIATPGERPASNMEVYALSLIYGDFFDISFSCSLSKDAPNNAIFTPYPFPNGDAKSVCKPLNEESLPWRDGTKPFHGIGFPIQLVRGHYHVALSEEAAQFLEERRTKH